MVLESVIFGLFSAIGFGVADLIAAVVVRKLGVLTAALAVHIASVGLTSVYLLLTTSLSELSHDQWSVLAGVSVLAFVFYLGFYRALQLGPVAIVSPILATHSLVVILLAVIFVGERLSGWQWVGAATTIGGIVLASLNLQQASSGGSLIGKGSSWP